MRFYSFNLKETMLKTDLFLPQDVITTKCLKLRKLASYDLVDNPQGGLYSFSLSALLHFSSTFSSDTFLSIRNSTLLICLPMCSTDLLRILSLTSSKSFPGLSSLSLTSTRPWWVSLLIKWFSYKQDWVEIVPLPITKNPYQWIS